MPNEIEILVQYVSVSVSVGTIIRGVPNDLRNDCIWRDTRSRNDG